MGFMHPGYLDAAQPGVFHALQTATEAHVVTVFQLAKEIASVADCSQNMQAQLAAARTELEVTKKKNCVLFCSSTFLCCSLFLTCLSVLFFVSYLYDAVLWFLSVWSCYQSFFLPFFLSIFPSFCLSLLILPCRWYVLCAMCYVLCAMCYVRCAMCDVLCATYVPEWSRLPLILLSKQSSSFTWCPDENGARLCGWAKHHSHQKLQTCVLMQSVEERLGSKQT